jgi:cell division septation protein DedD
MRGVFDERPMQQAEAGQDTEITLNPTSLLMVGFGLVLLCGLCFGFGYSIGHRAAPDTAALVQPSTSDQSSIPADSGHAKPSADAQPAAAAAPPAAPDEATTNTADAGQQSAAPAPAPISESAAPAASPQVKPALPNATSLASGVVPVTAAVAPALPGAGSLMVQIAAVSEQDDADVLMNALRRRGYAVAAHREPLDGLIHVRIGPFKTRDEAEKWRQKLLSDGYNAIVQP